jgi:DNA-binding CsgD family transcriptional regulator
MSHLLLFLYLLSIIFGGIAITFLISRARESTEKYAFLYFLINITFVVIAITVQDYIELNLGAAGILTSKFLWFFNKISYSFLLFTIPNMYFVITNRPELKKIRIKYFWCAVAFILMRIFPFMFFLGKPTADLIGRSLYLVESGILLVILMYVFGGSVIFLVKNKEDRKRIFVMVNLILFLFFMPGILSDMYKYMFPDIFRYTKLVLFMPFYYFFWNILLLYFLNKTEKVSVHNDVDINERIAVFCERNKVTKREQDVISLIYEGKSNRVIAEELFISESTVKRHVQNIFEKIGVDSRVELIMKIKP